MSKRELKSIHHEGIENSDDEELLQIIKELIEERYNTGRSTIKLSSARMSDLRKAKQDIDAGNVHSDEDVNRWIEAWLRA